MDGWGGDVNVGLLICTLLVVDFGGGGGGAEDWGGSGAAHASVDPQGSIMPEPVVVLGAIFGCTGVGFGVDA